MSYQKKGFWYDNDSGQKGPFPMAPPKSDLTEDVLNQDRDLWVYCKGVGRKLMNDNASPLHSQTWSEIYNGTDGQGLQYYGNKNNMLTG